MRGQRENQRVLKRKALGNGNELRHLGSPWSAGKTNRRTYGYEVARRDGLVVRWTRKDHHPEVEVHGWRVWSVYDSPELAHIHHTVEGDRKFPRVTGHADIEVVAERVLALKLDPLLKRIESGLRKSVKVHEAELAEARGELHRWEREQRKRRAKA